MSRGHVFAPLPAAAVALLLNAPAFAADGPSPGTPSASPAPAAAPAAEAEADVPTLQRGVWAYERTVSSGNRAPAQAKMSRCSDPTLEMRKKITELKQKGCRFSPTVHFGNTYRSSWMCPAHGGVVALAQVLTVTSDSSYEDSSEARFEDQLTRTKIIATRVGDCPGLPDLPSLPKHRPRPPVPSAPSSSPPSSSPQSGG